jgi:hypothetical protein
MYQRRIPEVRRAVQVILAVGLALFLGPTACSQNASPGSDSREPVIGTGSSSVMLPGDSAENTSTAARFGVPPGHLPPAGQCRVWMPGEPPGQQKKKYPVGQCSTLRQSIPAGGWLIYRPTDSKREVLVWEYGPGLEVLAERVYDSVTGELLRYITPPR